MNNVFLFLLIMIPATLIWLWLIWFSVGGIVWELLLADDRRTQAIIRGTYKDEKGDSEINKPLPYTHNKKLNKTVTKLMKSYNRFLKLCKKSGFDVRFYPDDTDTLTLYFNDDCPNLLLVDKDVLNEAQKHRRK